MKSLKFLRKPMVYSIDHLWNVEGNLKIIFKAQHQQGYFNGREIEIDTLNFLLRKGYILKTENGYVLSEHGYQIAFTNNL